MTKQNKLTVTVAIAAYNAEKNIKRLTESMLNQEERSFILKQIIVNSDSSSDNTVKHARSIKNKRLKVIDSKDRSGFAGALVSLVTHNDSDILLILNDDIIVTDKLFLEKTIQPFIKEKKVGLVCCNATPMKPENFVANAVRSGYMPYKKIFQNTNNGNHVFSVDGKALCFSKEFLTKVKFPKDRRLMANVDKFMYFSCIKSGFKYRYVKDAYMYFKCPTSIKDFTQWQIRNLKSNKYMVRKMWGDLVDKEYKVSDNKFRYYKLVEFIKNPAGSLLIYVLGIYCSYKAKQQRETFNMTWDLVDSTKAI